MAEKHIQAQKDYLKGMKYKEIAEMHGVSINTVKSWKQRHGWVRSKGAPKEKSVHTKKGGQPGNKNALGNKGGAAPKGNQNAKSHGFFSKFLPADTLEIMERMNERSAADLIWDQIQIQYAAIIRAQQIMFVESKEDMTKELKKTKESDMSSEEEYEIRFAWDKHATFLNAQSRAMSELRSLIKQFNELAHEDDERRLKLEQMRLGIEKTKAEVEKLTNMDKDTPVEIFIKKKGER
ncbi:phage terminase small subunit [Bacillus gobiensis]|uniref:phage terminase small subunit n=1 Tax=Bacillus gobiensis TaxID=1441095 RepID=UPI003D242EDB